MKNTLTLAITLAISTTLIADNTDNMSGPVIKDAKPIITGTYYPNGSWTLIPFNTAMLKFNSVTSCNVVVQTYGYLMDDPSTPFVNESNTLQLIKGNTYPLPVFSCTASIRVGTSNADRITDFNIAPYREIIFQMIAYKTNTTNVVANAHMRWVRGN